LIRKARRVKVAIFHIPWKGTLLWKNVSTLNYL
jgi:hypothetical protein